MLEGLFMLLCLSVLMGIASFLAGLLPLSFSLSSSQLRLVSTVGMGVLVGTSLIVIIPEGIETLYSANQVAHIHSRRGLQARNLGVQWGASLAQAPQLALEVKKRASDEIDAINALPGPVIPADFDITGDTSDEPPKTPTAPGEVHALEDMNPTIPQRPADQHEHHSDARIPDQGDEAKDEHSGTPHAWVGVSLISGFILMYLIDTLPSLKPPQAAQRQNIYSLSDLSASSSPVPNGGNSKSSFSTTLGLVIHSAADGIALGASSTQPSLSAIIFFAIFIHKAPAAFGLTSVLLKQGLSKRQARSHLIAFSLAAPIGAIFTFLVIHMLGGAGEAGGVHTKWWTGIVLLFSGGTFLYVAMHTMQDDDHDESGSYESVGNGYLDPRESRPPKPQKSLQLTVASVVGMLLPLLTQIGHAH